MDYVRASNQLNCLLFYLVFINNIDRYNMTMLLHNNCNPYF